MAGALRPRGGVRRDGEVLEGGGDEEEEGVRAGEGAGGSAVAEEDTVHPAGVRDLGGVGRGDGEVLRRVRAAQEAAQERGDVSLVCDIKFSMTRIHLLDHIGIHVPYQIEYFATVDFCIGTGPLGGPHPCPRSSSYR